MIKNIIFSLSVFFVTATAFGSEVTCNGLSDNFNKVGDRSFHAPQIGQLGDDAPFLAISRSTPIGEVFVENGRVCAIVDTDSLSKVYCWGINNYGQLGINSKIYAQIPVQPHLPEGVALKIISLGKNHTCGIGTDDKTYCWGRNNNGQLGINSTTAKLVPTQVIPPVGVIFKRVYSNNLHTSALSVDGRIFVWGGFDGLFLSGGYATHTVRLIPTKVSFPSGVKIKGVSSSLLSHMCAISTDNRAYCWGGNESGQLGIDSKFTQLVPREVEVPSAAKLKMISVGFNHTCGIDTDNVTYCWGSNLKGELGIGSKIGKLVPTKVDIPAGVTLQGISLGNGHTCGLSTDNITYCWGYNGSGQLGINSVDEKLVPTEVHFPDDVTLKTISLGARHSCGIGADGETYCWGLNNYGQLGVNSKERKLVPTKVLLPDGVRLRTISLGIIHTCGIGLDSKTYCWGSNDHGQLGINSIEEQLVPRQVHLPEGVTLSRISLGVDHTCGISTDNETYCWGGNRDGALDNGTQEDTLLPVKSLSTIKHLAIKRIAAGWNNTCVLTDKGAYRFDKLIGEGDLYCIGDNYYAQIGYPANYHNYFIPTEVHVCVEPCCYDEYYTQYVSGEGCTNGINMCGVRGEYLCNSNEYKGYLTCSSTPNAPSDEVCDNNLDDDCDGEVDEVDCIPLPPDLCPDNPNKTTAGICGCDEDDTDLNNNGIVDCVDPKYNRPKRVKNVRKPLNPYVKRDNRKLIVYMERFKGKLRRQEIVGKFRYRYTGVLKKLNEDGAVVKTFKITSKYNKIVFKRVKGGRYLLKYTVTEIAKKRKTTRTSRGVEVML